MPSASAITAASAAAAAAAAVSSETTTTTTTTATARPRRTQSGDVLSSCSRSFSKSNNNNSSSSSSSSRSLASLSRRQSSTNAATTTTMANIHYPRILASPPIPRIPPSQLAELQQQQQFQFLHHHHHDNDDVVLMATTTSGSSSSSNNSTSTAATTTTTRSSSNNNINNSTRPTLAETGVPQIEEVPVPADEYYHHHHDNDNDDDDEYDDHCPELPRLHRSQVPSIRARTTVVPPTLRSSSSSSSPPQPVPFTTLRPQSSLRSPPPLPPTPTPTTTQHRLQQSPSSPQSSTAAAAVPLPPALRPRLPTRIPYQSSPLPLPPPRTRSASSIVVVPAAAAATTTTTAVRRSQSSPHASSSSSSSSRHQSRHNTNSNNNNNNNFVYNENIANHDLPRARPVSANDLNAENDAAAINAQAVLQQARQIQERIRHQLQQLQRLQQQQQQRSSNNSNSGGTTSQHSIIQHHHHQHHQDPPSSAEQAEIERQLASLREMQRQNQQEQAQFLSRQPISDHDSNSRLLEVVELNASGGGDHDNAADGEDDNDDENDGNNEGEEVILVEGCVTTTTCTCENDDDDEEEEGDNGNAVDESDDKSSHAHLRSWPLMGAISLLVAVIVVIVVVLLLVQTGGGGGDDNSYENTIPPAAPPLPQSMPKNDWYQLSGDLLGGAKGDQLGYSVSLSGSGQRMAAGARYHNGVAGDMPYQGMVQVFEYVNVTDNDKKEDWVQLGSNLYGSAGREEFGTSVALSNDGMTLIVGAVASDANGVNSGQVRVFSWTNGDWTPKGQSLDGLGTVDRFGSSVAVSYNGTIVAAGTEFHDAAGRDAGHVRVFEYNDTVEEWEPLGEDLYGGVPGDWFGNSIALSADGMILAVGSVGNDDQADHSGQVRVFSYDASMQLWNQMGQSLYGQSYRDWFGVSVSLSADGYTLAAGSLLHDLEGKRGSDAGNARIFRFDEQEQIWIQMGQDLNAKAAGDRFGATLSLSKDGNRVAVGGPFGDGENGLDTGYVKVFEYDNQVDEWVLFGSEIQGKAASDRSGWSVSLCDDGTVVASGAPWYSGGPGRFSGHVRVFRKG